MLLPRPHVPRYPLWLARWTAIDHIVTILSSFESIVIDAWRSEVHARWSLHLSCMAHLAEAFSIVICLPDWLFCHLFVISGKS